MAKSGKNSDNASEPKKPAPSSRTNGPAGGARVPKGRVPVSSDPPSRSRRFLGRGPAPATEAPSKSSTESGDAVAEATGTTSSKKKYAYGGGALILVFIGAQLVSSVVFGLVQSRTTYDFTAPAGIGAAVGQASSQFASGQMLAISVPPPLWLTALMQIPLWLGLGAAPIWFAIKKGKGVVADLGLRMKPIDVPV